MIAAESIQRRQKAGSHPCPARRGRRGAVYQLGGRERGSAAVESFRRLDSAEESCGGDESRGAEEQIVDSPL